MLTLDYTDEDVLPAPDNGTISVMEANTNRDGYAFIIDGLDESDRENVRASYVIKK